MKVKIYSTNKAKRRIRVRSRIVGSASKPRLTVFRSNKFMYAQIVDDAAGKTLFTVNEKELGKVGGTKVERAHALGTKLAQKAIEKGIKLVVFDRGSYKYHGRVKSLAEGARQGGLNF
ncbi:MAG: 50S ribosomal protein L18 [Patescibacteria group bacterium]